MRRVRRLLPLILVMAGPWALAPSAGAVVNGEKVDPATVPWFVSIGSCGGTMVAPDRVLTAAHCVAGIPAGQLGGVATGGAVRRFTRVAMHPGWRHRNGDANFIDDIAIAQLDAPIDGVTLVRLGGASPADALILGTGRPFAPGTGHSEAEMLDGSLRQAPLRLISDAACGRAFRGHRVSGGERFDPRMRCAIDADAREPLHSGCNGDSGGPLWTGTPAAPVQLGVVSWGGDRCGADHLPSVFAEIDRYRAFITDPSPVWAPAGDRTAKVRITGRAREGRTLRCATGYRPAAGSRVELSWRIVGTGRGGVSAPRDAGRSSKHRVTHAERGRRLACLADVASAGGYVTVGAANVLVPR